MYRNCMALPSQSKRTVYSKINHNILKQSLHPRIFPEQNKTIKYPGINPPHSGTQRRVIWNYS